MPCQHATCSSFPWLIAALLTICLQTTQAQTTGTIVGQVVDPSNSPVVNATVVAENVDTGLTRTATTTAEGS